MSIKKRMIMIAVAVLMLGLGLLMLLIYSVSQVERMKNGEVTLQKIEAQILTLRKHEKDFLMRKDMKYFEKFQQVNNSLNGNVLALQSLLLDKNSDTQALKKLQQSLQGYSAAFKQLVEAYQNVGLDHKSGLQGSLRKAVHNIESQLKTLNKTDLTADMLMLRRREKDFLLRFDLKYLDKFNQDVAAFERSLLESDLMETQKREILAGLLQYQNDFKKMVDGYVVLGIDSEQGLRGEMRSAVHETDVAIKALEQSVTQLLEQSIKDNENVAIGVALLLSLIVILMSIGVARGISRSVEQLTEVMSKVATSSDLSLRLNYDRRDEIQTVASAFNDLLTNIQASINETNQVLSAVAEGDFTQRVESQQNGDLKTLKEGVNASAESVDFMMSELAKIMQALGEGQFDVKMDSRVPKAFSHKVDTALESINLIIEDINDVMSSMSRGEFDHRVQAQAEGQLAQLKSSVNVSMNNLEKAINELKEAVVAQSKGDLTHKIESDYQGELLILKEAFNYTVDRLVQVVASVLSAAGVVTQSSLEVSQGATDLSDRVQQQAASVEETSATTEEMNSAVKNNSENAEQATEVAHEVNRKTLDGSEVMKQTITAMSSIEESSHKISEIVNLIDSIAFQTNLLALNAAVEAARAGEHGRGFAVVAAEVRALAQKSAEAAKEISALISETVSRVEHGTRLASESGEMLTVINDSVGRVTQMIESIASASQEQSEGIGQIHKAISEIDQVTQQNAALVEQTSAASESLSEQSMILNKEMTFFRLPDGTVQAERSAPLIGTSTPSKQAVDAPEATVVSMAEKHEVKPDDQNQKPDTSVQEKDEWAEF